MLALLGGDEMFFFCTPHGTCFLDHQGHAYFPGYSYFEKTRHASWLIIAEYTCM